MGTLRMEVNEGQDPANNGLSQGKNPLTFAELNAREFPGLGSVNSVRDEINDTLSDMKEFHRNEPDVVMMAVSAHGARLAEIIVQARRIEVQHRQWKSVREEAEFVLKELRDHFNIASRLLSVRQLDQSLER